MASSFRFAREIPLSILFLASAALLPALAGDSAAVPTVAPPAPKAAPKSQRYESIELFQKVLHFVETNYVDDVNDKDLIEGAIKGMLENLDPHSNFLTADIFREMKTDTSGKFGGVGIEIGMKDGNLTVISPMEESPAWRAGVKPGDRVIKINGENVKGLSIVEAIAKMRGKKGSDLKLTLMRDGWKASKEFKLHREMIKLQTVKSDLLEPGLGYVKLTTFNEDAAKDIEKALKKLEGASPGGKLKGLVFDLRGNPGGLLDQAVDVSSLFMEEKVVVSTIGRDPKQKDIRYAKKGKARKELPVAVLVNVGSASASEIVAGALQDNKRAIIMGSRTFGKGSVQTVVELGDDMGLKLTIARYYTPSGRSIQEKGIQPDIEIDDYDAQILAQAKKKSGGYREKDLRGHLVNTQLTTTDAPKSDDDDDDDSVAQPQRFSPKDDYQVKQAANYLKSFEFFQRMGQSAAVTKASADDPK